MAISIEEFRVAMETYGAKRVPDQMGSRRNIWVPCFEIAGVQFMHSGSYYIVKRGAYVSGEVMDRAMAEFGEQHPGGDNFWWGEIHSVKGILTLALMLENKYSKDEAELLTSQTYKILLEHPWLKKNIDVKQNELHSLKFNELNNLLKEFHDVVNPFGNENVEVKNPIEYMDKVHIRCIINEEHKKICLSIKQLNTRFEVSSHEIFYIAETQSKTDHTIFGHYKDVISDGSTDEEVYLSYTDWNEKCPEDIDLRISLTSGLAYKTYKKEEATLATDEQIEIVIEYLKNLIKIIKQNIVDYIVK